MHGGKWSVCVLHAFPSLDCRGLGQGKAWICPNAGGLLHCECVCSECHCCVGRVDSKM